MVIKRMRPSKRVLKKVARRLGCAVVAIGILFAAGWHIPFPIEGNWAPAVIGCGCTEHKFMRFEDGKILNMSGHPPSTLLGTYRKTGLGRYELDWFAMPHDFPRSVRSTFLRVSWENHCEELDKYDIKRFIRDPFIFACRDILNKPENDWLDDIRGTGHRVAGSVEDRVFINLRGKTYGWTEIEKVLGCWLNHEPMRIYTASNEAPASVIGTCQTRL